LESPLLLIFFKEFFFSSCSLLSGIPQGIISSPDPSPL
jgi:hypothetical protein